jgi:hypothetical protein
MAPSLYPVALSIHVVTAILGLGQVAGIAILASSAPADAPVATATWTALGRLTRGTTWSLALMLLSGALIDYSVGGGYHEAWWFRLSFALLLVLGAINGRTRRALKKRESAGGARPLQGVARGAWSMCAIIAVIAVLMEVKPW